MLDHQASEAGPQLGRRVFMAVGNAGATWTLKAALTVGDVQPVGPASPSGVFRAEDSAQIEGEVVNFRVHPASPRLRLRARRDPTEQYVIENSPSTWTRSRLLRRPRQQAPGYLAKRMCCPAQ